MDWNNRDKCGTIAEYLLKEWYQNNSICIYVFIPKSQSKFANLTLFVDDLNIIETHG